MKMSEVQVLPSWGWISIDNEVIDILVVDHILDFAMLTVCTLYTEPGVPLLQPLGCGDGMWFACMIFESLRVIALTERSVDIVSGKYIL